MMNVVGSALQTMPPPSRGGGSAMPSEVPVRPPRERSLVRSILQGDALKSDIRRFFRVRSESIPEAWTPEVVSTVEQVLQRDPGYVPGSFLGLLRFSCDLREQEIGQYTWLESRLWSLVKRRLSTSSGLMLLRSVANAHEILRSLVEDPSPGRRRSFSDLLRILSVRTGQPYLEHPRTIDRAVWEFALVLAVRCDRFNADLRGTDTRPLRCIDLLFGSTSIYIQERGAEPTIAELRTAVLQTGSPLGPALGLWARSLARNPGQSLLPGQPPPGDPRSWVWETGRGLLSDEASIDRSGQLAACERALLDRASQLESWKDQEARAVHDEFRKEIERILPESHGRIRSSGPPATGALDRGRLAYRLDPDRPRVGGPFPRPAGRRPGEGIPEARPGLGGKPQESPHRPGSVDHVRLGGPGSLALSSPESPRTS
jgi:hypothetical protein